MDDRCAYSMRKWPSYNSLLIHLITDYIYTGDQLLDARDISCLAMRRPIDRGYVVNWETQLDIWTRALDKASHRS
eukprot:scaffold604486_cov51-Prasinocladus_malaysianus.AAC.1